MESERFFKDQAKLEVLLEKLRENYDLYKGLCSRHEVSMETSVEDRTHKVVYFSRPDTILCKNPDKQVRFRKEILERLSELPSLQPIPLYPDQLLSEFKTAKHSNKQIRKQLADFYLHHCQMHEQYKYKYLTRFIYLAQSEVNTFPFSDINIELENINREFDSDINRFDRLRFDDDYPGAAQRPSPKTDEGTNLFIEEPTVIFSSIARDDITEYISRNVTLLKQERPLLKYLSRVKWLHINHRFEVWKESQELLGTLKKRSIERMKLLLADDEIGVPKIVKSIVTNINSRNLARQRTMHRRARAVHSTSAEEHLNLNEQLLSSYEDDIDMPPILLSNSSQLNNLLDSIRKEFNLIGDLLVDDGHSLVYQVSHMFPEQFEIQKLRMDFQPYDEFSNKEITELRVANLQGLKVHRVNIVRKAYGNTEQSAPTFTNKQVIPVCKKHCKWQVHLHPELPTWQRRQQAIITKFALKDSLLDKSFKLLDLQDYQAVIKVLDELSINYVDRSSHKGMLKDELGLTNLDLKREYFSELLNSKYEEKPSEDHEHVELSTHTLKALYSLRILKSRNKKLKLLEILNAFRSVQRTINIIASQLSAREMLNPKKHEEKEEKSDLDSEANPSVPSIEGPLRQFLPHKTPELYGLKDTLEEIDGNIYVKDSTGQYVLYDSALNDLEEVTSELVQIGNYFIEKSEIWTGEEGEHYPTIDRDWLTGELLDSEVDFQTIKFKILRIYIEILEHTVEKSQQLFVCQTISNLMALRPRLNFASSYFAQSYWAHIDALHSHFAVISDIFNTSFQHLSKSIAPLDTATVSLNMNFYPALYHVATVWELVEKNIHELLLVHETEGLIGHSVLEKAVWEKAASDWRYAQLMGMPYYEEGLLLDQPELLSGLSKELVSEIIAGQWEKMPYISAEAFHSQMDIISDREVTEFEAFCNSFHAWNYRRTLELQTQESMVLEEIYKRQCVTLKKDSGMIEPADWNAGIKTVSSVDDGPGSRADFWLPLFEFDSKMKAYLHFGHPRCIKGLLLPWGVLDLKAAAQYQTMHKQLLAIGVQINQYAADPWLRQIQEIKVATEIQRIPRKSQVNWTSVLGRKGEGLIPEKVEKELARLQTRLSGDAGKFFYSVRGKKLNARGGVELAYKRIAQKYQQVLGQHLGIHVVLRELRSKLVNGYCKEVLREAYHEAIKVQMLKVSSEYRKLVSMCPDNLHNKFYEDITTELRPRILLDDEGNVVNPGHIPTNEDILKLKALKDEDKEMWTGWNPYISADTAEIVAQAKATKRPKYSDNGSFAISNTWKYPSVMRKNLEMLSGMLRLLQVKIFMNFLSEKINDIAELQDLTSAGINYWQKDENSSSEFTHRAVEQMLDAQSPRDSLHDKIKDAITGIVRVTESFGKIPVVDHFKYCMMELKLTVSKLAYSLFHSYHHSLIAEKTEDIHCVLTFITQLFRLNRKKFILPGQSLAPLYSQVNCHLIDMFERTTFVDHSDACPGIIPGAYVCDLDWGMLQASSEERSYVLAAVTTADIKIEHYISVCGLNKSTSPFETLEQEITYLDAELRTARLKQALFIYATGEDYLTESESYERTSMRYRDTIEFESQFNTNPKFNKAIARIMTEFKLLHEALEEQIVLEGIRFMQKQSEMIRKAADTVDVFGASQEFTCNVDGSYLDLTKKIGLLHNFLNTLRNRCTIVDAPSCGKALVFSVKDMSALARRFAEQMLRYGEAEFRAREEMVVLEQQHLEQQLLLKEKTIELLQSTLKTQKNNTENAVNAQLSQKGNQLIYELDISNRQLFEIKSNLKFIEEQIRQNVYKEFRESLEQKDRIIHDLRSNFKEFKVGLAQELKNDIETYKKGAFNEIKTKHTVNASDLDQLIAQDKQETEDRKGKDLVRLQNLVRRMRIMHQWSKMHMKQKYEKQIQELKENLSSNQYLWEQLNESQRRESLLKQELSYTQQALASAEKLADKLQTQIEEINSQRLRLEQYKASKGRRLNDLELKLKDLKRYEHVDNRKVLSHFYQQNKLLHQLKHSELEAGTQYLNQYNGYQRTINTLKKKLRQEKQHKLDAFDQLASMREEIQGLDQDPDSLAALWKSRYYELLEETKELRGNNATYSNLSEVLPTIRSRITGRRGSHDG